MYITQTHIAPPEARAKAPITILSLHGALDGDGVRPLLEAAQANLRGGARRVIVNLAAVDSLSSAGLVGLYMTGTLLEGRPVHDLEGWAVIGHMRQALEQGGPFANLSLAAPNQNVTHTLHTTHFDRLARTLPSVDDAIIAFPAA